MLLNNFSFAQKEPYHPLRIKTSIIIDGKLTEPEWNNVLAESDFMQYDPTAGSAPTEKTEVRILYNDEYLYIGFRIFDRHPDKLIRNAFQRDFDTEIDDANAFIIDMYNDKSTGLGFITNTLNARWDAEVSDDGATLNEAYNTFWDAASNIDSLGYTTEYRIPFSSLRFEAKDTIRMGFRAVRAIKRLNEYDIFPACDPQIEDAYMKVSLAREIEFYDLKSKKPFYITPYAIANYAVENVLNSSGTEYEKSREFMTRKYFVNNETLDRILSNIGFDVKYGISKNFTLDATVNTDFAQAEADDAIVNLTKYEVNLKEKRNFFLESQTYFNYTTTSGNELFISRSIGLENDVVVPIIAGARLTGKKNGWQMGLLDMETKSLQDQQIDPHNIFIFRTRKKLDNIGSYAGGIITNRLDMKSDKTSSQSFGIDLQKKLNQFLMFTASVAGTTGDFKFKNIGQAMDWNTSFSRTAREGLSYGVYLDWIGKNFLPALGFIEENDLVDGNSNIGYRWKAKDESKKAYYYMQTNFNYKWKPDLKKEERKFVNIQTGVSFKSGIEIDLVPIELWTDRVFEEWHLSDHIIIPTGVYKMYSPGMNFITPQKGQYRGSIGVNLFDYYGGKRISVHPIFTYFFNKHLSATFDYQYDHIQFPEEFSDNGKGLFQSSLVRLNVSYYFNTRISLKILTQFDQLSNTISTNLRMRYNPKEGTDLFIVLNQGLNTNTDRLSPKLPLMDNQAVIVKFLKTFVL